MSKSLTILMAMMLVVPTVAPTAAMAGPYVGIGVGGARMESSLAELDLVPNLTEDTDVIGTDPDFSSTDVSFTFTAGWTLGQYIGLEVSYTDFGRAKQNYQLPEINADGDRDVCTDDNPDDRPGGCQSREWTAQVDMEALQAFIIGTLPLNDDFDVYAKIGAISWDADYAGFERNRQLVPGAPPNGFPIGPRNADVSFDDDGTDLAGGIGLVMKTGTAFSLRADLSYYAVENTDLLWTAQLIGVYKFEW